MLENHGDIRALPFVSIVDRICHDTQPCYLLSHPLAETVPRHECALAGARYEVSFAYP